MLGVPMTRYWLICGYDGLTKTFEMTVAVGQFTDDQIKQMLRALAAKAGLEYPEIVGAYAKRGTKAANNLLVVERESATHTYWCGVDHHFSASVVDEKGRVIRNPKLP
jgi:hypothetical protein